MTFLVFGRINDGQTHLGIAGMRVEIWDNDLFFNDLIGSAVTDEQGRFSIEFDSSDFKELFIDRKPDLFFKVFRGDQLIRDTSDSILWNASEGDREIVIEVDLPAYEAPGTEDTKTQFIISGSVSLADGRPLSDCVVRAFEKSLRSEQLLGETTTDERGHYRITYRKPNKTTTNLIVRVFNPEGTTLGASEVLFNAPNSASIDIHKAADVARFSDYERLTSTLNPRLDGVQLADLGDEEITFLANHAGVERQLIELLRQAATLSRSTNLSTEVFYGWGRRGQSLNLSELLALAPDVLRRSMETALNDNIIPSRLRQSLDNVTRRLDHLRLEHGFLVRHEVTGQLLNEKTGDPLAGFTVRWFDLESGEQPQDLGLDITDGRGLFTLSYIAPRQTSTDPAGRRLRLVVKDRESREIHQTEIVARPDRKQTIEVRIPLPPTPEPPSASLAELDSILESPVDRSLLADLASQGIQTLADLRKAGGINLLERLPVKAERDIKILAAHADLGRITSDDPKLNTSLISKGFDSVLAIADVSRTEFVSSVGGGLVLGDDQASDIYDQAFGQTNFLYHVLTGIAADHANGLGSVIPQPENGTLPLAPKKCECKDCESAVSPLAYLADLLAYALKHLRNNGNLISLQFLEDTFHQPFGKLPASCNAVNEKVRQVRICIEVLRAHLKDQKPKKEYLLAAYSTLLNYIGTSYEELRLARNADTETRKQLADRLFIVPSLLSTNSKQTNVHVDTLLLDPDAPKSDGSALTELALAELFGFQSTIEGDKKITVPKLQSWQLDHLHAFWLKQDHPVDPYNTSTGWLPIIDPDLIGPDDFRVPHDENAKFAIWIKRRLWVDERLKALAAISKPSSVPGPQGPLVLAKMVPDLLSLFDEMRKAIAYGSFVVLHWPKNTLENDLNQLEQKLTQSANKKVAAAAATFVQKNLGLSVESFIRLMQLRAKDRQKQSDNPSSWLSKEEERELFSILVQSQKAKLLETWRDEEGDKNIRLDPKEFWISLSEPVEGDWPPVRHPKSPLIDPESMKLSDLPDLTAGAAAHQVFEGRRAKLEQIHKDLKAKHKSAGFEAMLKLALGHPNIEDNLQHDLDQLNQDLSDPNKFDAAKEKIENDLHLKLDQFARLMAVRAKSAGSDAKKLPTEKELEDVYTILTSARKEKHEFPNWILEEQGPGYWNRVKAKLPRWRATAEARQAWQQALRARGTAPIIDPDLITKDFTVGSTSASDLWKVRRNLLTSRLNTIGKTARTQKGLESAVEGILGVSIKALSAIDDEEKQGHSIGPRLDQLSIDRPAFSYLLQVHALLKSNADVLDAEWENVFSILLQVWKRREFATWRESEKEDGISHRPGQFKLPKPSGLDFPPPQPAPLPAWRASRRERREWIDKLQSRIDQRDTMIQALREAVSATEEEILPMLRDELIKSSKAKGSGLDGKAKTLTDALLIDARAGGCQMTTRIAQAIETVQLLIWSLRTGQLLDTYPSLALIAENFDEEWKWLGSYTTWRSAMFVFLYPENILQPQLRRHQTPAFRACVENLQGIRSLSDKDAIDAARKYWWELVDVSILNIASSCQVRTAADLFYLFGQGGVTRKVYWSTFNPDDQTGYPQTFWEVLPGLDNVAHIVAAVPYRTPDANQSSIYLFVTTHEDGKQKFLVRRYDPVNQRWDQEPTELSLPPGEESCTIIPVQRLEDTKPPEFVFDGDTGIYRRGLNTEVTGWQAGPSDESDAGDSASDWMNSSFHVLAFPFFVKELHAVFEVAMSANYCFKSTDGSIRVADSVDLHLGDSFLALEDSDWIGLIVGPEKGESYVFTTNADGQAVCTNDESGEQAPVAIAGLTKIIPHFGTAPKPKRHVAYQRAGAKPGFFHCGFSQQDGLFVFGPSENRARPHIGEMSFVDPTDFRFDLQSLRLINAELLELNSSSRSSHTYIEEAFYFLPIYLALRLEASGKYMAALDWFRKVYDYSEPSKPVNGINRRKIYHGLVLEESLEEVFDRDPSSWLLDPLDPHAIAELRPNAYTRFTLLSIIRCLLDYADAEFTWDTSESVPRARTLYLTALELLESADLKKLTPSCGDEIKTVLDGFGDEAIKISLEQINDRSALGGVLENLKQIFARDNTLENRRDAARLVVEQATIDLQPPPDFTQVLAGRKERLNGFQAALLTQGEIAAASRRAGLIATASAGRNDNVITVPGGIKAPAAMSAPKPLPPPPNGPISYEFCIPSNPVLDSLRLRAELNLYKLRTCRNIAGMERQLEPYAAPTDSKSGLPMLGAGGQLVLPGTVTLQPTSYRYAVLIERTKQLVQVAGQMETAMLSFLEKRDAEAYTLLKARQDVRLSREGIRLQDLRVNEAESGVGLAELQQERSQIQADTYQEWITAGPNAYESEMVRAYEAGGAAQKAAADWSTVLQTPGTIKSFAEAGNAIGGLFGPVGAAIGGLVGGGTAAAALAIHNSATKEAIAATVSAQIASVHATQERRRQEWELQLRLAQHDSLIGAQQIVISQDRVRVVGQERVIAQMQADHAEDVVEFLSNKFTDTELYDWMAGVLEGVYRYFLQQATSIAKLAEAQLAFERQEIPPAFIQTDYWEAATETGLDNEQTPDRRGLTGSARLLQDIYQLDQYAFATNKRKLQMSKTISLAKLDPFAFQQFRQTGLMVFATPMSLYDRDFPGHYLRLIKRVRTSVIALVPPAEGIHATLSTGGIYRVAIGGNTFQVVTKPRAPESVALTAPINATGIFELDPQPEMLLPFEGMGVDTVWEFRMPKAANHFDYRTIADVLITIEYTALNSFDYRAQVVQEMDNAVSIDRPFSFRAQFADQWYDLHNPEQTATPMTVKFKTRREDFPPNIDNLRIDHILLYFAKANSELPEISVVSLLFTELNGGGTVGGGAKPIECLISTRKGNAGSWMSMLGKSPIGEWVLTLPDELKDRFKNDEIEDILFAITCSGHTPAWPT